MVAQFAGQGYMVIAADYFGIRDSIEPEGYTVKAKNNLSQLNYQLESDEPIHLTRQCLKVRSPSRKPVSATFHFGRFHKNKAPPGFKTRAHSRNHS